MNLIHEGVKCGFSPFLKETDWEVVGEESGDVNGGRGIDRELQRVRGLCKVHPVPNITMMKSKRMIWMRHVARVG